MSKSCVKFVCCCAVVLQDDSSVSSEDMDMAEPAWVSAERAPAPAPPPAPVAALILAAAAAAAPHPSPPRYSPQPAIKEEDGEDPPLTQ